MGKQLIMGISNKKLLNLAKIGVTRILNEAIEKKTDAEKRKDTWSVIFYSQKSKECSFDLALIENAIDAQKNKEVGA